MIDPSIGYLKPKAPGDAQRWPTIMKTSVNLFGMYYSLLLKEPWSLLKFLSQAVSTPQENERSQHQLCTYSHEVHPLCLGTFLFPSPESLYSAIFLSSCSGFSAQESLIHLYLILMSFSTPLIIKVELPRTLFSKGLVTLIIVNY